MQVRIIQLTAAILASILVMIAHELPKAVVYNITSTKKEKLGNLFHLFEYIDPIGLFFCVIMGTGFSKPYPYKIERKNQAIAIGLTGLGSLLVLFLVSVIIYKLNYSGLQMSNVLAAPELSLQFVYWFTALLVLNSFGMFIVNLMPIAIFDMGLIIAGVSIPAYIWVVNRDVLLKTILLLVLVLEVIPMITIRLVNIL